MSLKLPDFSDPLLTRMHLCVTTKNADSLKLFGEGRKDLDAQYGDDFWLHLGVTCEPGGSGHFHLDVVRKFSGKKDPPNSDKQSILDLASQFYSLKDMTWLLARYKIPKEQHPKKGIIPALSISTEIGNETLKVKGAELTFLGEPFVELQWSLEASGTITVVLDAFLETTVDDDCMIRAEKLLREGLNRFVLAAPE